MKPKKEIFYTSTSQEVVNFKVKTKNIDGKYKYLPSNFLYKIFSFISYIFVALPIAWIYLKLFKQISFKNKKTLKGVKGGYFIYANHTHQFSDAFSPLLMCFPLRPYFIVNPDNISKPFIGSLVKMWGAIPTPNTIGAYKNFLAAINILAPKKPIIIYPEAHLWPYYTKIREFSSTSFRFPAELNLPIFTATTTYTKRKFFKSPKITIFIDGPFYANKNEEISVKRNELKNYAQTKMQERAAQSNYEYVKYIKRSKND